MSDTPQAGREGEPLKPHGDKLAAASGGRPPAAEPLPVASADPPQKPHGDKLRGAVDRAVGET